MSMHEMLSHTIIHVILGNTLLHTCIIIVSITKAIIIGRGVYIIYNALVHHVLNITIAGIKRNT